MCRSKALAGVGSCLLIRAVHVQVKVKLELTPAAVIEGFSLPEFSGSFLAVTAVGV